MEQLIGFVNSKYPQHVRHLNKALYGFKQAPQVWLHKFADALSPLGFIEFNFDYSLIVF